MRPKKIANRIIVSLAFVLSLAQHDMAARVLTTNLQITVVLYYCTFWERSTHMELTTMIYASVIWCKL